VPFARRVGRFNEHLDICRRLWAGEKVTHHSDFYDLDEVQALPTPPPRGRPSTVGRRFKRSGATTRRSHLRRVDADRALRPICFRS
jgi:alkanesulfonate monooxygenase SsuD/methylene tetrahydromethanopterin reductase-like flavin-dependent oxidoreductase (luciferase family)